MLSSAPALIAKDEKPTTAQQKVLDASENIFNSFEISYVYGGSKIGSLTECDACNRCLESANPNAKERLEKCPGCRDCSLDCSHFTQMIFRQAGFYAPYLTTQTMIETAPTKLRELYQLIDFGTNIASARPGDLLVYNNHVVLLTKVWDYNKGDIIHATGGKDIRGPGAGIQRERLVSLSNFRGPVRRILRHKKLLGSSKNQLRSSVLRPVIKKEAKNSPP